MRPILKRTVLFGLCATALLAQSGWRRFDGNAQSGAPQNGPGAASQQAPSQQPYSYEPPPQYGPPPPAQITVPAGTWLTIRVNEPVSSDHNRPGDPFTATLVQPLVAQGFVVARRGQTLSGRVSEAAKAGYVKGTSRLAVELMEMTVADGQHVPLRTELVAYSGSKAIERDATAIGATTGMGAAIGAAVDGGFGAGMGAIAGAGASIIGVLVTRGPQTVIVPEDTLTFRTTAPMTISTESAPLAFQPVRQEDYEPQHLMQRGAVQGPPPPSYYGGGWGPPYYGGPYWGWAPFWYGGSVIISSGPHYGHYGGYYGGHYHGGHR